MSKNKRTMRHRTSLNAIKLKIIRFEKSYKSALAQAKTITIDSSSRTRQKITFITVRLQFLTEKTEGARIQIDAGLGTTKGLITTDIKKGLHEKMQKSRITFEISLTQPLTVGFVMPRRSIVPESLMAGQTRKWAEGWNDALDELVRLNPSTFVPIQ